MSRVISLESDSAMVSRTVTNDTTDLEFCRFTKINSRRDDGGAIFTTGSLYLFCCLFEECHGRKGGAIKSRGVVHMEFVSTHNCSAEQGGVLDVRTDAPHDIIIDSSTFMRSSADLFGVLFAHSLGFIALSSTNVTLSYAQGSVGAMEIQRGSADLHWFFISNSSANAHNGGLCLRDLASLGVESCVFHQCRHDSQESETAAAILVIESPQWATLSGSLFLDNVPGKSHVVTVVSGASLVISSCCFTGSENLEIAHMHCERIANVFGDANCKTIGLGSIAGAGYHSEMKTHERHTVSKYLKAAKTEVSPARRNQMIWIGSVAVALVAAGMLRVMQIGMSALCSGGLKVPKAFQ
jgi:hypothetical protein